MINNRLFIPQGSGKVVAFFCSCFLLLGAQETMSNDVIASAGGYTLVADPAEDGRSTIATLFYKKKKIGQNEDAFELLLLCKDDKAKTSMIRQFVKRDIKENGGAREYQSIINFNVERFGPNFYDYIDRNIVGFYKDQGVDFSPSLKN
jgi:hypothetical protein